MSPDLGLPAYESIPKGPRILAGLFQGLAARASGLAIVPVASLAPALQYATIFGIHASLVIDNSLLRFLYVVMMYIAVNFIPLMIYSHNSFFDTLGVSCMSDPIVFFHGCPNCWMRILHRLL